MIIQVLLICLIGFAKNYSNLLPMPIFLNVFFYLQKELLVLRAARKILHRNNERILYLYEYSNENFRLRSDRHISHSHSVIYDIFGFISHFRRFDKKRDVGWIKFFLRMNPNVRRPFCGQSSGFIG